jgi:hypothetical protein
VTGSYFLATDLTERESARENDRHGVGYYKVAIRRHGRPGFVYRFPSIDGVAQATLRALNHPVARMDEAA